MKPKKIILNYIQNISRNQVNQVIHKIKIIHMINIILIETAKMIIVKIIIAI
jgi:hypothetical protein